MKKIGFLGCVALLVCLALTGCRRPGTAPGEAKQRATATKGAALQAAATPDNSAAARSPIGTNLDGLVDWSEDWISVDAFKRSRPWISGTLSTFDDGRALKLDARGWVSSLGVGQVARTLMFWDGVKYPSGDYVVLYEGKGRLEFFSQDRIVEQASRSAPSGARATESRTVLRVDSSRGGIGLLLRSTDPRNPIRNIRVIMPGGTCAREQRRYCDARLPCVGTDRCLSFEENHRTQIFHPRFLERSAHYGVLRFMDWMQTNGATQREWSERTTLESARWNQGAPLEVMIELANRQGQDAWFTLPHTADDHYVYEFARLTHEKLSPRRKVYIEHSNEVWNSQFPQAAFAQAEGQRLGLGPSPFEAQLGYHARRTAQLAAIWERVFADRPQQLVRVLAAQAANAWTSEVMLTAQGVREHVDVIAVAPYFGGYLGTPEEQARVEGLSLDQLFDELRQRALPEALGWMEAQAKVAGQHGVTLVAYEGGQHLTGVGSAADSALLNQLFDRANRDPRMGQLYAEYLAGWRRRGGRLFVHFSDCSAASKWGRWGALEWLEQARSEAPKFDAISRFIEQNRPWWSSPTKSAERGAGGSSKAPGILAR